MLNIELYVLLGASLLLGVGQKITAFSTKLYVYECSWHDDKAKRYVNTIEKIEPLAGIFGMSVAGTLFWYYQMGITQTFFPLFYYYEIALLSLALILSFILPIPPYSRIL